MPRKGQLKIAQHFSAGSSSLFWLSPGGTVERGLSRPCSGHGKSSFQGMPASSFGTAIEDLPRWRRCARADRSAFRLTDSPAPRSRSGARPCGVTQTCLLERVAHGTTAELATSEIGPHDLVLAPRNSGRRSLRARRDKPKGGRPDRVFRSARQANFTSLAKGILVYTGLPGEAESGSAGVQPDEE